MARTQPLLTTKLLKVKEVCDALGISEDTFSRHWQGVFTETRDPAEKRKGVHRHVFEDEVAEAVNAGGGARGRAAVLTFRRTMRRL